MRVRPRKIYRQDHLNLKEYLIPLVVGIRERMHLCLRQKHQIASEQLNCRQRYK